MVEEPALIHAARIAKVVKHCTVVTWLNVCVTVWHEQTLVEDIAAVSEVLGRLSREDPQGVGLVQFVDDGCRSLSPESRAAITKMLERGRPYIKCSTVIFNGDGFRAAAIRALATGIFWLARPGFPHQVFADTASAAALQASYLAPRGSERRWAEVLREVVDQARGLGETGARPASTRRASASRG